MTWLKAALMVAAIFALVTLPLVGLQLVTAVRCGYIAGGYQHSVEYRQCLRGEL